MNGGPASPAIATEAPEPERSLHHARRVAAALLVSLALHAALLALFALRPASPVVGPKERPIAVDILTQEDFAALTAAPTSEPAPAPIPPEGALAASREPAGAMVQATTMLSASVLADSRSAEARAVLATVDDTERMIQLCGIEAMEQVHAFRAALHPDRIVAYASEEVAVGRDRVEAGGAAFRSGRSWYELAYSCRLAADHATVVAFAFKVGERVPPEAWEARNLPADFDEAPD